jgi:hypothetical protein
VPGEPNLWQASKRVRLDQGAGRSRQGQAAITLTVAAYNLVRIPKLMAATAGMIDATTHSYPT